MTNIENTVESEHSSPADFRLGRRFGKWQIENKLDCGGFGQVYRVEHIEEPGRYAALKVEPNDVEGGSAIKLEIMVINALNRDGDKQHVVKLYHAAKHKTFSYMIVTLLGENLRTLKINCPDNNLSVKTWSRIGIQCLYGIKLLHDVGFIHRDIKPANFAMGHENDVENARCVHILDFGLARSYAYEKCRGQWIARRARRSAEFRGTMRYCSPSVHEKKEQGRKDDIWSLIYLLIEMHCGLPWQHERDKGKLEIKKMNISDKDLLRHFPEELHPVVSHLRMLNCYNRPDYSMIHKCFLKLMKRFNVSYDDRYDWESDLQVQYVLKHQKKRPDYEHAQEFFAADPVKINGPPPPGSNKRQNKTAEELEEVTDLGSKLLKVKSEQKQPTVTSKDNHATITSTNNQPKTTPKINQPGSMPNNNRRKTTPKSFQPKATPTDIQPRTTAKNIQRITTLTNIQIGKTQTNIQPGMTTANIQRRTTLGNIQSRTTPANIQRRTAPGNIQPKTAPTNIQPKTTPTNIQRRTTPGNIQSKTTSTNIQRRTTPGNIQPKTTPTNIQPKTTPTNIQPKTTFNR